MASTNNAVREIPHYGLDQFQPIHRDGSGSQAFGYNRMDQRLRVPGFELYSSEGLAKSMGPLKSSFYRVGLTLRGSCNVQLGLEQYTHQPGTVNCTFPNQVFSKFNLSDDLFGYYILFNPGFLDELVPDSRMPGEFPFFDFAGVPFFRLEPDTVSRVVRLLYCMNDELQLDKPGKTKAIRLYLYLLLLEMKRSYEAQLPGTDHVQPENSVLVSRFRKLVSRHFLQYQQVADYAGMLHITPNHLNRVVKEITGKTASDSITEMMMQEAKALLQYTTQSAAEIAYHLLFSDPSSFNRFFKKQAGITPLAYRQMHHPVNSLP
jgi:AraC-like DNA-binding protein